MKRTNIRDIAVLLGCRPDLPGRMATGVCVDSREAKPGQLFLALEGVRTDGHVFLAQAAASGAVAAVVDPEYYGDSFGLPLMRHSNRLAALQLLAQTAFEDYKIPSIAVTGSLGKTTTKTFLSLLLASRYRIGISPANYNSQIGLPLTLLNYVQGNEELLVLEMGMTEANQIKRLVEIAPPAIALITSVELVHAENFDSYEDIARAKGEIFSSPHTQWGILDASISNCDELRQIGKCSKKTFASQQGLQADYCLVRSEPEFFTVAYEGHSIDFPNLPVPGEHNRHNFLAAVAAAHTAGLSWDQIQENAKSLYLPERRFQKVVKQGITFINDSYNAALPSVKAALRLLPEPPNGNKRIAVLGPMPELGKFSAACHREAGEVALECVDALFCLGEECLPMYEVWQKAGRQAQFFKDQDLLLKQLKEVVSAGDVVLIKGSNRRELWKLLEQF